MFGMMEHIVHASSHAIVEGCKSFNERDSSQMLLNHSFVPLYPVCIFCATFVCELVSASCKLRCEAIMRRMENATWQMAKQSNNLS